MGRPMLEGFRVLDLSQYLAGAGITRLLAELGPEIIKVELTPDGDPSRFIRWVKDGRSSVFIQNNRGKQSLCLNWDTDEGMRILRELVPSSEWQYIRRSRSLTVYEKRRGSRAGNAAKQLAQLPWFAKNVALKVLLTLGLGTVLRKLGRAVPSWPY